jgi:O-antigen ligase
MDCMNWDNTFLKTFYISFVLWALSAFSSITLVGVTHIVMVAPAVYFFVKGMKEGELSFSASSKVLMAICVVAVFSIALNYNDIMKPIKSMTRIKYYMMGFGLVPVLSFAFRDYITTKRLRVITSVFLVVLIIATLSDIYGHLTGFHPLRLRPSRIDARLSGLFGQTMTYGYLIQFVCLLLVSVLIYRDTLLRYFNSRVFYFGFVIAHIGLIGARSRGAIIGYGVGLLVIFFLKSKRVFKYLVFTFGILFTIAMYVIVTGKGSINLLQKYNSASNMIRISQYETALHMFKDNPLVGIGYNTFDEQTHKYKDKYKIAYPNFRSHAHSNLFEFLSTTGIIGFSLLLLFHVFWAQEILLLPMPFKSIMSSILAAFFVSGNFQNTITDGEVMFFFMMLYALTQVKKFSSLKS